MFRAEKKKTRSQLWQSYCHLTWKVQGRICVFVWDKSTHDTRSLSTVYEFPRESSLELALSGLFMCELLGFVELLSVVDHEEQSSCSFEWKCGYENDY